MKKFITFTGIATYCIFSLAYIIYGFFDHSGQIVIAHFTGAITFLTLLFACLLAGYMYCQEHKWNVLLGFLACGLMGLGYFMYTFLHITAESATVSSLLFDISSTLLAWSFALPLIYKLWKDKPGDNKK